MRSRTQLMLMLPQSHNGRKDMFLTAMLVGAVLQSTLLSQDFSPKLAINPWKLDVYIRTIKKAYKTLKIGSDWIKLDLIGSNQIKSDQIGSNWIQLVQTGSNWIKKDQDESD